MKRILTIGLVCIVAATAGAKPQKLENKAADAAANAEMALLAARAAVAQMVKVGDLTEDEIADLVDVFTPWSTGVAYALGDVRSYGGKVYECIQAHSSQVDWHPDAVPALWALRSPSPVVIAAWVQPYGGSGTYTNGAIVTHKGQTWINSNPGPQLNVWEPGVYGWTVVP